MKNKLLECCKCFRYECYLYNTKVFESVIWNNICKQNISMEYASWSVSESREKKENQKICCRHQNQCHLCSFLNLYASHLRYHMRTHQTGENSFNANSVTCNATSATVQRQSTYETHSREEVKIMSIEWLNHEQSQYHLDQKNFIATKKYLHHFDISN